MSHFSLRRLFLVVIFVAGQSLVPAHAWPPSVAGDELAVWQAVAASVAEENTDNRIKYWYYESEFTTATYVSASISDPDKADYCGLSYDAARVMLGELKALSNATMVVDSEIADAAGFKLGAKKNPRFPYFSLSRVVFDSAKQSAWLAIDINGTKGAVVRVDKVDGKWTKTGRCGGWQTAG